jgi:hypothetical protein
MISATKQIAIVCKARAEEVKMLDRGMRRPGVSTC